MTQPRLPRVLSCLACLTIALVLSGGALAQTSPRQAVTVELQGLPALTAPGASIGLNWAVAGGSVCEATYVRWDTTTHDYGEAYPYSTPHYSGGMKNYTDYIDVPAGASAVYLRAYALVDGTLYRSDREYQVSTVRASDTGASEPFLGSDGTRWYADIGNSDIRYGYVGGTPYTVGRAIGGTTDDAIYQTQRQGVQSYWIKLTRAVYAMEMEVELHLAELEVSGDGLRVFDILLEPGTANEVVFPGVDIHAMVGKDQALVLTHAVRVDDYQLDVAFAPVAGKPPVINGIVARGLSAVGQRGELVAVSNLDDDTYVESTTNSRRAQVLLLGGQSRYHVGLRFWNVRVPQGAYINHAELRLMAAGDYYPRMDVRIYAEAVDNTQDFTMLPQVPGRPRSDHFVPWLVGNDDGWHPGEQVVSPELRDVIQEMIDRNDWASSDELTLLLIAQQGDAGPRGVYAIDHAYADRPLLFIEYSLTSPVTPTPTSTYTPQPSPTPTVTPTATRTPIIVKLHLPLLMRPVYVP